MRQAPRLGAQPPRMEPCARTQPTARIEDEIWTPAMARAEAEGATLAALMRAAVQRYADGARTSTAEPASQDAPQLTSHPVPASQPGARVTSQPTTTAITIAGQGEPSPGAICMTPRCYERNTSKYGLRKLPLCPACAAALQGQVYKREIPSPPHGSSAAAPPDPRDGRGVSTTSGAPVGHAGQARLCLSAPPTGGPQRL